MKNIYDATFPITDKFIVYPGDIECSYKRTFTLKKDGYNWSEIHCGTHISTHLDVPLHFYDDGASLDDFPFDLMVTTVHVVETNADMITRDILEKISLPDWRVVFFKTKNQKLWHEPKFCQDYVSLDKSAAEFLVEKKNKMVGIDYKSIESFYTHDYPVHQILLGKGVNIIEGLYLNEVPAGNYNLYCFPMRLKDGDGGPVRVMLSNQKPIF